jgi:hypothetical protein
VSLIVTLLGFALTAWALRLTYDQARQAKLSAESAENAADAAALAVRDVRFKLDRYSAYRDLSEAEFAMNACKQHLQGEPSWSNASDNYDIARRALIRVAQIPNAVPDAVRSDIRMIIEHISMFCDQVDAARYSKSRYPNPTTVSSAIRKNYETLAAAKAAIEKDIS